MASDRYVVLGVARVRAPWFRDVARWSTSAVVAVEFVKAMSLEEVRVRLRSGRGYSVLLADDGLPGVDRDLVDLAREVGAAVILVEGGRVGRDHADLGASAVLPASFTPDDLLQALSQVATPIARATGPAPEPGLRPPVGYRGRLVAVTGAGGTGSSTVAAALAQGLAGDPRSHELVCLADLALHGDQAVLHGSPDVVPGVIELVEAHRGGLPTVDDVRRLTWHVRPRGYHLLLGLRRHRDWTAVRPRAFSAALDGLRRGFRVVVADVDADVEGEAITGSLDVEERNTMARTTLAAADLVVVVGVPGLSGLHGLVRTTLMLIQHGVPGSRLVPVVNRAPRGPRARAELSSAFATLVGDAGDVAGLANLLFLAERRGLDAVVRDRARLPASWAAGVAGSVTALLESTAPTVGGGEAEEPVPIHPGQLGSWATGDEGDEDP